MLKKKSVGFSNTFVGMANWHEQVQSYIRKHRQSGVWHEAGFVLGQGTKPTLVIGP
jgi:hypothetical protein